MDITGLAVNTPDGVGEVLGWTEQTHPRCPAELRWLVRVQILAQSVHYLPQNLTLEDGAAFPVEP